MTRLALDRRGFLKLGAAAGAAAAWPWPLAAQADTTARPRPNIVLILADDLGYECLGANGGTSYHTPNLDALARQGVRFEHCYAQPLCTPTRVQLMTGVYNVRNYTRFAHLDPRQPTFANILRDAGYATCVAGKWQLGGAADAPRDFGFDEYYLWQHTRRPPRYANPGLECMGKEVDYTSGEYGPDLINAHALDFIARHRDQPFFLYYPMVLTHAPFQPTPDSPDWDPKAKGEKVNVSAAHFGDMVAYMDKLVGRVVAKLDELKLRENTLVLFLGDNGTGRGVVSQMGTRTVKGGKGDSTDAGTRVPLIAAFGGITGGGRVLSDLVDTTDFLPTICEATGVPVPPPLALDGRSFLPQLRGQAGRPREWVYSWFARDGGAVAKSEFARTRRYKLYAGGRFYDISRDSDERAALDAATLDADATAARTALQAVLDGFKGARPARVAALDA